MRVSMCLWSVTLVVFECLPSSWHNMFQVHFMLPQLYSWALLFQRTLPVAAQVTLFVGICGKDRRAHTLHLKLILASPLESSTV